MRFSQFLVTATTAVFLVFGSQAFASDQMPQEESRIDPTATTILKRMTSFLSNAKQFKVKTENTLEYLLDGHRIDIDVSSDVIISRPNKIKADRIGKLVDQHFYYNGKELTLFHPETNFYATEPVPDNYLDLFRYMAEKFKFAVPISDLILKDAYPLLMEEVELAVYLGRSRINGVICDQVLFSRPGVDFQLWVAASDKPYPYKYVITDTSTTDHLSIRTTTTDWDFNPEIKESDFTFIPSEGAEKIEFLLF